jgi:hypothetical protein
MLLCQQWFLCLHIYLKLLHSKVPSNCVTIYIHALRPQYSTYYCSYIGK